MDFSFSEDQEAIRELATRIFTDLATHERLRDIEGDKETPRFDRKLWSELAGAGLTGINLPEDVGGAGLGFIEAAIIVEAAGKSAAYVPAIETIATGAPAIAEFGSEGQRQRWLPGVVAGDVVVTTALVELGGTPDAPALTAEKGGAGYTLTGSKSCVPSGLIADVAVVPARLETGDVGVFLVDLSATGVSRTWQLTNAERPDAILEFDHVALTEDDLLGSATTGSDTTGSDIVHWLVLRATAAAAVAEAGVTAASLALTAEYTKTREQFDRPIATFQAVGQRAADAYVDSEAIWLTAWQAAWRIAEGLPADDAVAVAKFWAAEGGQRVVHAAVHLHGGVGVDRDYPLHRYFLLTKQLELTLGGATEQLLRLGAMLAAEPV
jgi:alkylation response protein AidB-like acyl-CoA dehydrogenase